MVIEISQERLSETQLAHAFRALGDANRLAIFQLLRDRCGPSCEVTEEGAERTVTEIAKEFELSLSTVSHHLKELRTAGLVLCTKQGRHVHCRINDGLMHQLERFLGDRR